MPNINNAITITEPISFDVDQFICDPNTNYYKRVELLELAMEEYAHEHRLFQEDEFSSSFETRLERRKISVGSSSRTISNSGVNRRGEVAAQQEPYS